MSTDYTIDERGDVISTSNGSTGTYTVRKLSSGMQVLEHRATGLHVIKLVHVLDAKCLHQRTGMHLDCCAVKIAEDCRREFYQ